MGSAAAATTTVDVLGDVLGHAIPAVRREGQEVRYTLVPEPLDEAPAWIAAIGARWDERLARLRALLSDPGN